MMVLGENTSKVVENFEEFFGKVRAQTVPCDGAIQLEDTSAEFSMEDSGRFRSIFGMCLYFFRDRPNIMYAETEIVSRLSKPTGAGFQHLRKLMGSLKTTGKLGIFFKFPTGGEGKWKRASTKFIKNLDPRVTQ